MRKSTTHCWRAENFEPSYSELPSLCPVRSHSVPQVIPESRKEKQTPMMNHPPLRSKSLLRKKKASNLEMAPSTRTWCPSHPNRIHGKVNLSKVFMILLKVYSTLEPLFLLLSPSSPSIGNRSRVGRKGKKIHPASEADFSGEDVSPLPAQNPTQNAKPLGALIDSSKSISPQSSPTSFSYLLTLNRCPKSGERKGGESQ